MVTALSLSNASAVQSMAFTSGAGELDGDVDVLLITHAFLSLQKPPLFWIPLQRSLKPRPFKAVSSLGELLKASHRFILSDSL